MGNIKILTKGDSGCYQWRNPFVFRGMKRPITASNKENDEIVEEHLFNESAEVDFDRMNLIIEKNMMFEYLTNLAG